MTVHPWGARIRDVCEFSNTAPIHGFMDSVSQSAVRGRLSQRRASSSHGWSRAGVPSTARERPSIPVLASVCRKWGGSICSIVDSVVTGA